MSNNFEVQDNIWERQKGHNRVTFLTRQLKITHLQLNRVLLFKKVREAVSNHWMLTGHKLVPDANMKIIWLFDEMENINKNIMESINSGEILFLSLKILVENTCGLVELFLVICP